MNQYNYKIQREHMDYLLRRYSGGDFGSRIVQAHLQESFGFLSN